MADELEMSYETIVQQHQKERRSKKLTPLDAKFYQELYRYLNQNRQRYHTMQENDPGSKRTLIFGDQLRDMERFAEDIYTFRERKIVRLALDRAWKLEHIRTKAMVPSEKRFFEELVVVLRRYRARIFEQRDVGELDALEELGGSSEPGAGTGIEPIAPGFTLFDDSASPAPATPPLVPDAHDEGRAEESGAEDILEEPAFREKQSPRSLEQSEPSEPGAPRESGTRHSEPDLATSRRGTTTAPATEPTTTTTSTTTPTPSPETTPSPASALSSQSSSSTDLGSIAEPSHPAHAQGADAAAAPGTIDAGEESEPTWGSGPHGASGDVDGGWEILRILEAVPSFVTPDGRVLELLAEDVVTLPVDIAHILLDHEKAHPIRPCR